jgi:apolipoprotein N-acyltransferase
MSRIGRVLRDRGVQRRMGAAALSGVLLALAFPAFDIGVLAFVALVPLLWAWRGETPGRAALYGFVFGVVFAGILMYWLWYFGIVAIVPLVAAWAAYTALTGYLVGCLNRRSQITVARRRPWVVPRHCGDAGLSAGCRGATSAWRSTTSSAALASWGSVALVSFVLVAFNGYLVELAVALRARGRRSIFVATAGVGVVVALVAGADLARYQTRPSGELRIAALQGNEQDRYLTNEEKRNGFLTEQHFAPQSFQGTVRPGGVPESSLDDFSPEATRVAAGWCGGASSRRACQRGRPRTRRARVQPEPALHPGGASRGHVFQGASRPVR